MIEFDNEIIFQEYCLSIYQSPIYSEDEFKVDLNKTIVIKKLFRRYLEKHVINERLVLNTLIIFINVFGVKGANNILFHKLAPEFYPILKAFLEYLNSYVINTSTKDISSDKRIIELLKAM